MGCGSSQVEPGQVETDQRPGSKHQANGTVTNAQSNGVAPKVKSSTDSNANRQDATTNNQVPKSVMFTVPLDGEDASFSRKRAPSRLQKLDPLNVPKLTAEELKEKQRLADEKREQALQKRVVASQKSSKRRRELQMAQQFDAQQQSEKGQQKIQESLESAEKTREARMNDIKEKQRVREERAKRAREKAKKLNQIDQADLGILEVEKDEDNFNASDVDSWLDGENNDEVSSEAGERIYSGRASPKKRVTGTVDLKRGTSSSTIDSFDQAFNRKPPSASHTQTVAPVQEQDDFFDS